MMNEDSSPNLSPEGREGNVRDVVACVVRGPHDRVLIGRRPATKRHGGLWEFPGGKVRDGETLAEAADRELREELEVRVVDAAARPDFMANDTGSPFRILFLEVRVEGTPRPLEHEALAWFDPASGWAEPLSRAASDAPVRPRFAPADARYAGLLTRRTDTHS